MANQKKKAEAVKTAPAFRGYVRKDLSSEEDVVAYNEYAKKSDEKSILTNLFSCVDNGYKVSLKIDGQGYKVELFNVSGPEETHGYILSAYGNAIRKALVAVFFKHYELLEEDWSSYVNLEPPEVR
jgi:hypothetical protein